MASTAPALAQGGEEIAPYSKHPSELRPYYVCPPPTKERASCEAVGAANPRKLAAHNLPAPGYEGSGERGGFSPGDLREAYDLPSEGGEGITVAITIAFDDPKAEEDLAVYRSHYGLPPCTSEGGCFKKVNQEGEEANYPEPNAGWAVETSLDLEMVSATCPQCHILLVEADSNYLEDLGAAVQEAASLEADVISDSWGAAGEFPEETELDHYFDHPGTPVLFASGDSGYGVEYPAASPDVIAVGGTSLKKDDEGSRGWNEAAWEGAGSGCSAYEEKPTWEHDEDCAKRTVANVSAVADPSTPVSLYDTFGTEGTELEPEGKWWLVGGTSVAAPLTAGVEALSSSDFRSAGPSAFPRAGQGGGLFDVTEGENSGCESYLCKAGPGYDGPTGWGVPTGPLSLPVAVTEGATIDSEGKATLHGSVNPKGKATEYHFEYGTSESYGTSVPVLGESVGSGDESVEVAQVIAGLEGATVYHYRLVASKGEETFYGLDRTFVTTPPSVSPQPASEVGANDAKLNATVNPEGAATAYRFEYGPTTSYGRKTSISNLEVGTEAIAVPPKLVDGLDGETTYHFRLVATNSAGTTYGEDAPFTTQPAEWVTQATPKPHPEADEEEGVTYVGRALESVSCASENDCMAVGGTRVYYDDSTMVRYNEALHWDGKTWTPEELPMPESVSAEGAWMKGVSCPSPDSCFGLGSELVARGGHREAFIDHWDGEQWSAQTLPPRNEKETEEKGKSKEVSMPIGISCASPTSCMAVVRYGGPINVGAIGYFVWNGEEWSQIPQPGLPKGSKSYVSPPSCPSIDTCMLVAENWSATWDGESWHVEEINIPRKFLLSETDEVHFSGLSCVSADSCMAAGSDLEEVPGPPKPIGPGYNWPSQVMSAYWDGEEWTIESMPEPAEYESMGLFTEDVSCSTAGDCEIVDTVKKDGAWQMLAEHWDGEQWSIQSGANPLWPRSRPRAVSCLQGRCTAVGSVWWLPFFEYDFADYDGDGMFAARLRSAPTATTESATVVGAEAATLNAKVNPEGYETTYQFEYVDQVGFEERGFKDAAVAPASPEAIGAGTSNVEVSEVITGLTPGSEYHFRVKATNSAGIDDDEGVLRTERKSAAPALEPPAATFPASFSAAGEQKVWLRGGSHPVKCATESGVKALSGEGSFETATTGTATFTLHNCTTTLGLKCTTSGQAEGTIKTEALPFRLIYLSDGEPGVLLLPNKASGKLLTAKCTVVGEVKVSGSGVLGRIAKPALGEASQTMTLDFAAPETGKEEFAQQYVKTEAGLEYGLEVSVGGAKAIPTELEAEPVATFGGKVGLGKAPPALEPPAATFPASFSAAGEQKVWLRGGSHPVKCATESGVKALSGEGSFETATTGTATFTLHNCTTTLGLKCTTSGQAEGTIKTEALPFRLTYLSDGEPGVLLLPNKASGKLLTAKCTVVGEVKVSGSGVLGRIAKPALGEASQTMTLDFAAPETGKEEFAQQYVKTEAGLEYGLEVSVGGAKAIPTELEAEPVATFGGKVGLGKAPPALEPPAATFPASFSAAGEQKVWLRGGSHPVKCATESGVKALSGEGSFETATTGTATFTLHNCTTTLGLKCTTSGQAEGTIKTEALPFRLTYLSDGEPGVLLLPNKASGKLLTAKCTLVGEVKVSGSGVLGRIAKPALGEASQTMTLDFAAPETGKEEFAQQYVKTAAGLEYGLEVSVGGAKAIPTELEAEPVASFSDKATLGEG